MSKLLFANYMRLLKKKIFWIGMTFMFLSGTVIVLKQYEQHSIYGINVKLESVFFSYMLMIGVISAIFCSLFLGVEYSDGTMRNKIIVGHRRIDIYLSNLIVNISAAVMMCVSYILSNTLFGITLIGFQKTKMDTVILLIVGSMVTVIALCSIFTMISLLVSNKALAPVICIVSIFLLIAFTNEVQRVLDEPKLWYDGTVNYAYVDAREREQLEFIYTALPAGQGMQYSRMETKNIKEMCLYSFGIVIITSVIGIIAFKRKDIK